MKECFDHMPIPQGTSGMLRASNCWGTVLEMHDVHCSAWIQVLIMHGENDILIPVSNSRHLASSIPNSQLVVVPCCGHTPQEEMPQMTVDYICEALAQNEAIIAFIH